MKGNKATLLTLAEKCKTILASNWQGNLNKIKAVAKGSSCMYIDSNGGTHEVDLKDIEASKADPLSPFSSSLIDGINQSEVRRRALVLFCIAYLNRNAKDALMFSVDGRGFDVLGKVLGPVMNDGSREYQWKEFRFTFKEAVRDVESFCQQLVEMEEEALKTVSSFSGLG